MLDGINFSEILTLKAQDGKWKLTSDDKISIKFEGTSVNEIFLKENIFFEVKFADMSTYIKIYVVPDFINFSKYSLSGINELYIGSESNCHIMLPFLINIFATLKKTGYDFYAEKSENKLKGLYINSIESNNIKLSIGDVIFSNGIFIIYMKDFILINDNLNNLKINNLNKTIETDQSVVQQMTPVNDLEKNVRLYTDDQLFVHSPRLKRSIERVPINFDAAPSKSENEKMPAIFTLGSSAIITLTSGVTLITSVKSYFSGDSDMFSLIIEFVLFGAMFISGLFLPMLMNSWEKHMDKKKEKIRQKKYRAYIQEQEEYINEVIKNQENILKSNNLLIDKIEANINNELRDIWNREIYDDDFLEVVLGVGNMPALLDINAPTKTFSVIDDDLVDLVLDVSSRKYELKDVPITFSITKNMILPIVINSTNSQDFINSIMLQLLYFNSGNDLKIIVITDKYNENKWEYMKHLPHNWSKNFDTRFYATTEEEVQKLSMYFEQIYESRINNTSDNNNNNNTSNNNYKDFSEYYLIVTDNYKLAREFSVLEKCLNSNKNIGFSALIFEHSIKDLPSRFNTFVQIIDDSGQIIDKNTTNKEQLSFNVSLVKNLDIEKYAKIISNIPLSIRSAKYDIPSALNFLDMFYAGRVAQLNVYSRWTSNNPTTSIKTPIGMKEGNKLVELDLHEKFHGPHGLIAGSTGSGKSEFIITYILSLAVNYHPYEVQFVLIDYKGGGLAGAFENRETGIKLPHLVGTITNLDKSEMNRTLVSIKSELQRRQRVFNEAREKNGESTIDIYKYQRMYREGKVSEPMSHLFIISDEFAELKAQQPEFMDELVSAARIGRSLGVHLILATQKPSGVVDDQIWSNTRFRVCLKVQTTEDSNELLKRNDAAYIKEAGRFYLQIGNDEIFELAQSGWAGAKYVPSDNVEKKLDDNLSFLTNTGEIYKQVNEEVKKDETKDLGDQLTNIVKYLYDLALREKIKFSSLWLDNIPPMLYYNDISKKYNSKVEKYYLNPVIGEYDDPENQKQGLVTLPFMECGNVYIGGVTGSGKTTLLSTMIYSLIINHGPDEVNIYVIDMGAEKLKVFRKAPQVGEVLTINNSDKIKFLLYMLIDEKNKRVQYYSENGGDFTKDVMNKKCPFPNIVLIINQFDIFKENYEDFIDEEFVPFTRNCAKYGIYIVLTSSSASSLSYAYENNFPKKIMLNMVDPSDYVLYFNNPPIPKKNAGRGIIAVDNPYEFQTALICDEDNYDKYIQIVILQLTKYLKGKAKEVPEIPEEVSHELFEDRIIKLKSLPVGINMQSAQISCYDFDKTLTVLSGENINSVKNFIMRIMNLFLKIENTKIIVLNSNKNIVIDDIPGIKYYNSNFDTVTGIINKNVEKYYSEPSQNNFIIIVLGYAKIQKDIMEKQATDNDAIDIDSLIINSKKVDNFKYILFDKEAGIQYLGDGKLDGMFKRNNGIWLGKSFEEQSIFEFADRYDGNNINVTNSNAVFIKNGKKEFIKFI